MKIPEKNNTTANAIYKYYESRKDSPRYHLGASLIGHDCDRYLWYTFRWCYNPEFGGRMLKLFQRGQDEEARIVSDLRAIGCKVSEINPDTTKQWRVSFSAHFSGSCDGIIESGLPEAPKKRHVLEIKTHNKKSFDDLEKKGVHESKPTHYAQMQVYMFGLKIDRAFYFAVCKDDDRIYTERVRYDPDVANRLVNRAGKIIDDPEPPVKLSENPTWYQCKMCSAYDLCHGSKKTTQVNCRTCAHSTPTSEGWHCAIYDGLIPNDFQEKGCRAHVLHPGLVPWEYVDGDGKNAIYKIDGKEIKNGNDGVYSKDLITGE